MSKWYSFEELKRARTPMPLDSETGLPDNHVITVVERVISVDDSELIQNNVRTDTFTLNLDAEYDDLNVVVIFTKPNNINVKVAYNGTPTHIPGSAMELVGSLACSVVGIDADGEVRAVTKAAPDTFQVVKSGAYDGSVTSDDAELLGQILQAVSDAENAINDAETATTEATNATSQANSAATSANQAASSANSAASSANGAAARATSAAVNAQNAYDTLQPYMATIDSCANILHREVGPDSVVTADDSFPCKPVEMTVYGNTRQNLWVNPRGTSNGVTCTSNADGSMMISGASNDGVCSINAPNSYILKPNTTYTVSCDKKIDAIGGKSCFTIIEYDSDGSQLTYHDFAYSDNLQPTKVTFTTKANAAYYQFRLYASGNATVSGTYRVMLNEGSEPEPWCPPGLNGVDELSIVTAGKNLFPTGSDDGWYRGGYDLSRAAIRINSPMTLPYTSAVENVGVGNAFQVVAGQAYTLTVTGYPKNFSTGLCWALYERLEDAGNPRKAVKWNIGGRSGKTATTDVLPISGYLVVCVAGQWTDGTTNAGEYPSGMRIQCELGSTATDYEPPNITTTPIDLDGHTLNALPDGTRDELRIDGGGNVVLVKRVHREHIDADDFVKGGTEYCNAIISTQNSAYKGGVTFRSSDQRNDFAPIGNADYTNGYPKAAVYTLNGETLFRVGDGTQSPSPDEQLASVKAKVGAKGIDAMWALLEPQTIDLGTITPPTMAAPNVTAYVADDTPAEMELDYVRDINIVVDRLEKKVADLVVTEATIV